jgi:hypothetical protein
VGLKEGFHDDTPNGGKGSGVGSRVGAIVGTSVDITLAMHMNAIKNILIIIITTAGWFKSNLTGKSNQFWAAATAFCIIYDFSRFSRIITPRYTHTTTSVIHACGYFFTFP